MSKRRLLVVGGTTGIGNTAYNMLMHTGEFDRGMISGIEFDARERAPMVAIALSAQPTDVVFSVGINRLDWIDQIQEDDFSNVMQTNVWAFVNMLQCLRSIETGPVNVVVVTSDAAWRPMRTSLAYCASKAALEMAVRVASREYAPQGWRINAVAPGKVADTPMTHYVDQRVLELRGWSVEAAEAYELQSTPLGRKVTKEEVGEVIAHVLFGPAAQTGEIIAVNGGR